MQTRLILVEGIWGSGKTTLLETLRLHFGRLGFSVRTIFDENDPIHPCYETGFCDTEEFCRVAGERLGQLVKEESGTGKIVLLEAPFLNGAAQHFLFSNLDRGEMVRRTVDLAQRFAPPKPKLIHLFHPDTAANWRRTCAIRGEDWEAFMERMLSEWRGRYALPFRNMVEFLTELRSVSDRVFDGLTFPRLAVETSAGNWPEYYERIAEFLQVPPMDGRLCHNKDYMGTYREPASGRTCEVFLEDEVLRILGLFSNGRALSPFLRRYENGHVCGTMESFVTAGMSNVEIRFRRGVSGEIDALMPGDHIYGMPPEPSYLPLKDSLWEKKR